jgi:hypothetical protein
MPAETIQADERTLLQRAQDWRQWNRNQPFMGSATWKQVETELLQKFGAVVTGGGVGRFTAGLLDVPVNYFSKRGARVKLRDKIRGQGLSIKDLGTAAEPLWRISDSKGESRFINPDAVTEGTYDRDVLDFYARFVGVDVTPEMRTVYDSAKFVGAITPVHKVTTALTGNIPARPWLLRIFQTGLTGAETNLLMQVEDEEVWKRGEIDFKSAWKTGGWFAFFGGVLEGIHAARSALADAKIIRQFLKANPGAVKSVGAKNLKYWAKVGRDVQEGMPWKTAKKMYGKRMTGIVGKLEAYKNAIKWKPAKWRMLPEAGTQVSAKSVMNEADAAFRVGDIEKLRSLAVRVKGTSIDVPLVTPKPNQIAIPTVSSQIEHLAHAMEMKATGQPMDARAAGVKSEHLGQVLDTIEQRELSKATTAKEAKMRTLRNELGQFTKKPDDTPLNPPKDKIKKLVKKAKKGTEIELRKDKFDDELFKELANRQPWEPTHVTIGGDIVSQQSWTKNFREPGLGLYVTPKEYYLRLLGFDELIQPITNAAKYMYLENLDVNKWARSVEKRLNKVAKPSLVDKISSKLMGHSTLPVQKMAVLLNQYKTAPKFLSPAEKKIFTEIRNFTQSLLARANMMRNKLGLKPIKDVGAYMTHWLDGVARQAISKKYPFPHEVEYWIGRRIPKKIRNPLAEERKIRDDLLNYFSRDLGKLLSVMARYELRDIYLSEPYSILKQQLHELRKEIPARSRKALDDYLRHDIFKYQTDLDNVLNTALKPATSIINPPLQYLTGRTITNPIRSLSTVMRKGIHLATIWGRPRLAIRNLGQKLLIQDLYPQIDYLHAQFWSDPPGLMEMLREHPYYKISTRKWADTTTSTALAKVGMLPYQKAHAGFNYLSNVDVAMKTGWYYGERMRRLSEDVTSKFYKDCVKRFLKTVDDKLKGKAISEISAKKGPFYDAFVRKLWNKQDALVESTEAGSLSQWTYHITDMPYLFRGHGARAGLSLQSWWQNYFFKHWREGMIRTFTGETSRGKYIRPVDRLNFLKGQMTILLLTEAVRKTTGLDYERFYLGLGPAPFYLSPLGAVVMGTVRYMTAKTDAQRKRALSSLKYSYKAFIPGSLAWRDLQRFLSGEYNLKQYLFYTEPPREPTTQGRQRRKPRQGRKERKRR